MKKPLNETTLGIIHASILTTRAVQPFIDQYLREIEIMHVVDDTIQRDNIRAGVGVIPKVNYYKFSQYAHNLEEAKVDLILLACSTFNFSAELARPMVNTPIMQIDRTMMEMAVEHGRKIGLLATLNTTVPSSERLLRIVAKEKGKDVEIRTVLCSEAFAAIQKGDAETHNAMLLEQIDMLSKDVDSIVMAQLSMSALTPHLKNTRVPVYDSGSTTFPRIRELLAAQ